MTLEQVKAEEIVLKYHKVENLQGICNMTIHEAKECAKIHVNGIIEYIQNDITIGSKESKLAELNEVHKEIDNL